MHQPRQDLWIDHNVGERIAICIDYLSFQKTIMKELGTECLSPIP